MHQTDTVSWQQSYTSFQRNSFKVNFKWNYFDIICTNTPTWSPLTTGLFWGSCVLVVTNSPSKKNSFTFQKQVEYWKTKKTKQLYETATYYKHNGILSDTNWTLLNEIMAAFLPALASFSRPPYNHGRITCSDTCYHTYFHLKYHVLLHNNKRCFHAGALFKWYSICLEGQS